MLRDTGRGRDGEEELEETHRHCGKRRRSEQRGTKRSPTTTPHVWCPLLVSILLWKPLSQYGETRDGLYRSLASCVGHSQFPRMGQAAQYGLGNSPGITASLVWCIKLKYKSIPWQAYLCWIRLVSSLL